VILPDDEIFLSFAAAFRQSANHVKRLPFLWQAFDKSDGFSSQKSVFLCARAIAGCLSQSEPKPRIKWKKAYNN
jgi:hypothetical protein